MDNGIDWDERYAAREQVWSGRPNGALLVEIDGLAPGTALDVGCGEGADAVWLAERGWQVTGLDVAQVALDRAAAAAAERALEVRWICSPLEKAELPAAGFDLVTMHYPALPASEDDAAARALLGAVAPGGTLLVVGHVVIDREHALAHGFDPDDYVSVSDLAALLDDRWTLEVHEQRDRVNPPAGADHIRDEVLRARRAR